MFEFFYWIWNLSTGYFFNNYINFDNTSDNNDNKRYNEDSKANYICPICSYNMRNTRCYEFECVNYAQVILSEF